MVPRRRITSAMSVAGLPGPGRQRRRMSSWKNRDMACWTVVVVLPAVRSSPWRAPWSRPCQNGVGVFTQDLGGVGGAHRVRDPAQHVLQASPGQGCGVEVDLDDLGGLGRVEASRVVTVPSVDGTLDGAGGEGFRASFGDHRVDASVDRVPDQLGDADRESEGIEDDAGPVIAGAAGHAEKEVVEFGQGDQRGAGRGEQRGSEQVQSLAAALRSDDAGGAVPRHPKLSASRFACPADPPADALGVKHSQLHGRLRSLPYRSGRTTALALRSLVRPSICSASARVAMPWTRWGPQRSRPVMNAQPSRISKSISVTPIDVHKALWPAPPWSVREMPTPPSPPRMAGRLRNSSCRAGQLQPAPASRFAAARPMWTPRARASRTLAIIAAGTSQVKG